MRRWLKFFIGMALAPAAAGEALAFRRLVLAGMPGNWWAAEWFWGAVAGALLFLAAYWLMPRPMWVYVLGHEMTHALCVWLAGGKVFRFHVSSRGGHVATNKVNWWIALSPYFVPFYTLLWIGVWWSVDFYYPLAVYEAILFGGIGFTYAFHVVFTASMLHAEQADLSGEGFFFSGVVILFFNLLLVYVMFAGAVAEAGWREAAAIWWGGIRDAYHAVATAAAWIGAWRLRMD